MGRMEWEERTHSLMPEHPPDVVSARPAPLPVKAMAKVRASSDGSGTQQCWEGIRKLSGNRNASYGMQESRQSFPESFNQQKNACPTMKEYQSNWKEKQPLRLPGFLRLYANKRRSGIKSQSVPH